MSSYQSPGVYVEEVPSAVQPIAGVGTSTAGFIGIVDNSLTIPVSCKVADHMFIGRGNGSDTSFVLPHKGLKSGSYTFYAGDQTIDGTITEGDDGTATVTFDPAPEDKLVITGSYLYDYSTNTFNPVAALEVKLCTNFAEFKKFFGDFSIQAGTNTHQYLAHAVYGFFNNGGTRCYVARITGASDIDKVLDKFAGIDEISLVVAPGIAKTQQVNLITHCADLKDRFAILDGPETIETGAAFDPTKFDPTGTKEQPDNSPYAAYYIPWIQVFDPAVKADDPRTDGLVYVPPSGHVAGIYARVDTQRGVHKAPANEVVLGALKLKYDVSKPKQDGLNPQGINCIRSMNGNIRVWGARTLGGDANGEWKYINVRRLFIFLRESIDKGTQWSVFEPNDQALWSKIKLNVTAFLTNVWRSGALFGSTPQEAFYVKCDAEINPPEIREQGQVITEIGVAIVRPAEFVIFRISQWAGADAEA